MQQDHNLCRQYTFDGSYPKGAFSGSGYSNILTTEFGFPSQHSKISVGFNPTLTLEFLGVVVISQDMTLDKENTATT